MNPWENIEYQKISNVKVVNGIVHITFGNGDTEDIPKEGLFLAYADLEWDKIDFNSFEIIVPHKDGVEINIPWDKIRVITDSEFSRYLANKADEQAESIGKKLKVLRASRNILSKDLAERSGLTPQTITRIEKGKQDVNFKTLQKILTAMGYSLRDLAQVNLAEVPKTFKKLIQRFQEIGISRNLFFDKLVPTEFLPMLSTIRRENPELLLDEIARSVSTIFGWSLESIWSDKELIIDESSYNQALYKLTSKSKIAQVKAYSHYANFVAKMVLKATPHVKRKKYPESVEEVKEQFFASFDSITLENVLKYTWDLGIRVIPFLDTGVFHGASWNIEGKHVIVIKQKTESQARWAFDLLHELCHVLAHLEDLDDCILELEEISPFSDTTDDREKEANDFANALIFNGKEEEYAQMCVKKANGKLENLKWATQAIAKQENIREDFLANHLAFRLQNQSENWWGTANNLQITNPEPFAITQSFLQKNLKMEHLSNFESKILERALSKN